MPMTKEPPFLLSAAPVYLLYYSVYSTFSAQTSSALFISFVFQNGRPINCCMAFICLAITPRKLMSGGFCFPLVQLPLTQTSASLSSRFLYGKDSCTLFFGYMSPIVGGDKRDRTADLLNAIQALSQLSYTPVLNSRINFPNLSA